MKNLLLPAVFIAITAASASYADDDSLCGDAGLGGVSVDGEKQRMTSVYYQAVKFPDRSGIRKAVIIAEERAKGEMVRYFSQNQSTMRTIEETDSESEEATRLVDENGSVMNRSITRAQAAVLTQVDASFASGDLSGMMKIEESYDSDAEEESGRRNMLGGEWIPGQGSVQSPRYSTGGRSRGRPVGGRRGGRR